MFRHLGVALAGAIGALARYWIGSAVSGRAFPWTTLGINVAGSFALGLVLSIARARGWSEHLTVPLAVGFLGAFTTFSTFSYETQLLLRASRPVLALAYVAASVAAGVLAAFGGYGLGRSLT